MNIIVQHIAFDPGIRLSLLPCRTIAPDTWTSVVRLVPAEVYLGIVISEEELVSGCGMRLEVVISSMMPANLRLTLDLA